MKSENDAEAKPSALGNPIRPKRKMGQNFLKSPKIAEFEAGYAEGKNALELGAGLGVLPRKLCEVANSVVAIEKDRALFDRLKKDLVSSNLKLVNADFFDLDPEVFGKCDIMVSNIPYNISSKVLMWLSERKMQAVLCLQSEFVEHIIAKQGSRKYSKLSVFAQLNFRIYPVKRVSRLSFYPSPKVDSSIILLDPKDSMVAEPAMKVISLLMEHKKKRMGNALADSSGQLGIGKALAKSLAEGRYADMRPFQLAPEELASFAEEIAEYIAEKGENSE